MEPYFPGYEIGPHLDTFSEGPEHVILGIGLGALG